MNNEKFNGTRKWSKVALQADEPKAVHFSRRNRLLALFKRLRSIHPQFNGFRRLADICKHLQIPFLPPNTTIGRPAIRKFS